MSLPTDGFFRVNEFANRRLISGLSFFVRRVCVYRRVLERLNILDGCCTSQWSTVHTPMRAIMHAIQPSV